MTNTGPLTSRPWTRLLTILPSSACLAGGHRLSLSWSFCIISVSLSFWIFHPVFSVASMSLCVCVSAPFYSYFVPIVSCFTASVGPSVFASLLSPSHMWPGISFLWGSLPLCFYLSLPPHLFLSRLLPVSLLHLFLSASPSCLCIFHAHDSVSVSICLNISLLGSISPRFRALFHDAHEDRFHPQYDFSLQPFPDCRTLTMTFSHYKSWVSINLPCFP